MTISKIEFYSREMERIADGRHSRERSVQVLGNPLQRRPGYTEESESGEAVER